MTVTTRLKRFLPSDLTPAQRAVYDSIVSGPRSRGVQAFDVAAPDGSLHGPFNALLLNPAIGDAMQCFGAAIRYESTLDARVREAAILIVANVLDSDFERYAHEAVARQVGLTEEQIFGLRSPGLDTLPFAGNSFERGCLKFVLLLIHDAPIGDDLYRRLESTLGSTTMFELSAIVGYYRLLAQQLELFAVRPPTDALP